MKIIEFEDIDSTNEYIKRNYEKLDNFTFVTSLYQSNGKGRFFRKWESIKGENLLFSILIKADNLIDNFSNYSINSAICIAKYLEFLGVDNVSIKWPNDVYVDNRKIAGILLEGCLPKYIVIGVGININQTDFPKDLNHPATSIKLLSIKKDFKELKEELFNKFSKWIDEPTQFRKDNDSFLINHNFLKNKKIIKNDKIYVVNKIDEYNNLIVKNDKETLTIFSDEVCLIYPY